jgi:5-formyltetrahydrofolate cyclo-ligase
MRRWRSRSYAARILSMTELASSRIPRAPRRTASVMSPMSPDVDTSGMLPMLAQQQHRSESKEQHRCVGRRF